MCLLNGIYPLFYFFMSALFLTVKKVETTQNLSLRKQGKSMVNSYNGTLLSKKNERTTDACSNINKSQKHVKQTHMIQNSNS